MKCQHCITREAYDKVSDELRKETAGTEDSLYRRVVLRKSKYHYAAELKKHRVCECQEETPCALSA